MSAKCPECGHGTSGCTLSNEQWKALWHLLYNVSTNNLFSPYVGDPKDNVRGPLQSRWTDETVLDPYSHEQLLELNDIRKRLEEFLFPEDRDKSRLGSRG